MDVARKALILARLLGYPGELRRTAVESLVPKWARALSLADFLDRLEELDAGWKRRVAKAAADGTVLRYVATVTPPRSPSGVRAVPARESAGLDQGLGQPARLHDGPLQGESAGHHRSRRRRRGDGRRRAERHPAPGRRVSGRRVAAFAPGERGQHRPRARHPGAGRGRARATRSRPNGPTRPASTVLDPGHPELPRDADRHTSALAARAVLERSGPPRSEAGASRSRSGRACRSPAARAAAPPRPWPARWR